MTEAEFIKLRDALRKARRDRDREQGRMDELMAQVEHDFGCSTVEEVETLLIKLKEELKVKEKEVDIKYKAFIKEYGDEFEGIA